MATPNYDNYDSYSSYGNNFSCWEGLQGEEVKAHFRVPAKSVKIPINEIEDAQIHTSPQHKHLKHRAT